MMKKLTWDEFFAKHGEKDAKPYEFREPYRENHIVFHPKFGKGFVSEVVSESKVEITFQDARRVLVHNRRDIPGLPLVAEGDGTPTPSPGSTDGVKHKDHHKEHHHKEPRAEREREHHHKEAKAVAKPPKAKTPPPVVAAKAKAAAKPERKSAEKGDKASGAKAKSKPARPAAKAAPKKKAAARKK
jgi:hypothetical protein